MKKFLLSFLLICLGLSVFSQSSHIQIVSGPNLSVFLNGKFVGTTNSEFDGLIIQNLDAGSYAIKIVKPGFTPQETSLNLKTGEVYTYNVKPFVPKITVRQQGNESNQVIEVKTGNLKIQSLPVKINIQISGTGINSNKTEDEWYADDLPVGEYSASFSWKAKTLYETITIREGALTDIFVNLANGTLEYRGKYSDEYNRKKDLDNKNTHSIHASQKGTESTENGGIERKLNEEEKVFYIVEDMPEFNDGDPAIEFKKYIKTNLRYPGVARENGISGRVIVQFAVNKYGRVVDAIVVAGVDPALDKEAIRVVMSSPPWNPGKQRGKAVKVLFTFAVDFAL